VIGKVHRLWLSGRAAPSQPARATLRTPRPARPATGVGPRRNEAAHGVPSQRTEPVRVYVTEEPAPPTVLTLSAQMCKWPIGDPSSDGFTFCGRGTEGTYCSEHSRVAYQPPQNKKRSSPNELARSLRRYI
jgi:GcrA cell cycle regulator